MLRQLRGSLADTRAPGDPCVQPGIRTTSFPQRFRQPTSIDKYTGEIDPRVWLNDYRLACQLGDATTDEVIIRNLLLHLVNSARTWLEHLPPSQIHNWDDLVRTFVGNFQGTYVCPGNSWDLRACTQKPGEVGGFPAVENVFLIFGGPTMDMSNSQCKREQHEVVAAEKAPPSFLDWSPDAITFSREDHPNHIPNPGQSRWLLIQSSATCSSPRC
jgi:hypothetical protein